MFPCTRITCVSPQLDLAKGNRWANNVQRSSNLYRCPHLLYQNTFYHVSDFWPWKAMVLIVVAWCWSIKILDDWIIILWTSDPFCVTLEVHREACLRIKILDKLYWIVLLNQEPVFLNHGHCGIHLIDFVHFVLCLIMIKKLKKCYGIQNCCLCFHCWSYE